VFVLYVVVLCDSLRMGVANEHGAIPAVTDARPGAVGGGFTGGRPGPSLRIGGRELDLRQLVSRISKTFLCIGPICLRSGIGFGAGIGCGAGIGRGAAVFRVETSPSNGASGGGFSLPYQMMNQIPGGYQMVNVLKTVMRKFPGSKTGVGCGVGVGYGFGIGLQYGAAGGGVGGGMMGGMGGMGGGGMSGMGGGGMGGMGGGGLGGMMGPGGGGLMGGSMVGPGSSMSGAGGTGQSGPHAGGIGAGYAHGSGGAAGLTPTVSEERIQKLEKKVADLEDKVGFQLRLKELEQRLSEIETSRKRR
jgi:hypothetical protein